MREAPCAPIVPIGGLLLRGYRQMIVMKLWASTMGPAIKAPQPGGRWKGPIGVKLSH